ncbi:unannotated protein [freshwater metagenome]|uniref:Unannotated protein n=1 Tax=freshwater metagenome TaxID=449393 RepID=A0A6J7F0M7_9ZZZZ
MDTVHTALGGFRDDRGIVGGADRHLQVTRLAGVADLWKSGLGLADEIVAGCRIANEECGVGATVLSHLCCCAGIERERGTHVERDVTGELLGHRRATGTEPCGLGLLEHTDGETHIDVEATDERDGLVGNRLAGAGCVLVRVGLAVTERDLQWTTSDTAAVIDVTLVNVTGCLDVRIRGNGRIDGRDDPDIDRFTRGRNHSSGLCRGSSCLGRSSSRLSGRRSRFRCHSCWCRFFFLVATGGGNQRRRGQYCDCCRELFAAPGRRRVLSDEHD